MATLLKPMHERGPVTEEFVSESEMENRIIAAKIKISAGLREAFVRLDAAAPTRKVQIYGEEGKPSYVAMAVSGDCVYCGHTNWYLKGHILVSAECIDLTAEQYRATVERLAAKVNALAHAFSRENAAEAGAWA